jgi:hypothetical protein
MSIHHIRLYDLFRRELHLSDDKAADFVLAVEDIAGWEVDTQNQLREIKEDVHSLEAKIKEDIHSLEAEIKEDIHSLEAKIKEDIHSLEAEIKEDIHYLEAGIKEDIRSLDVKIEQSNVRIEQSKAGISKAIFWSGIVQLMAILSAVLAMVKFMK